MARKVKNIRFREVTSELLDLIQYFVFDEGWSWMWFTNKFISREVSVAQLCKQSTEFLHLKEKAYERSGKKVYLGTDRKPKRRYKSKAIKEGRGTIGPWVKGTCGAPSCGVDVGQQKRALNSIGYCSCGEKVSSYVGGESKLLPEGKRIIG